MAAVLWWWLVVVTAGCWLLLWCCCCLLIPLFLKIVFDFDPTPINGVDPLRRLHLQKG
jgi:hypothetical protein